MGTLASGDQGWCAAVKDGNQWYQFDLRSARYVVGVETCGRGRMNQYVTRFTVKVSNNGHSWSDKGQFDGNVDNDTPKQALFAEGTSARYVRIYITAFNEHPSMRSDVLIGTGPAPPLPPPLPPSPQWRSWDINFSGLRLVDSQGQGPLQLSIYVSTVSDVTTSVSSLNFYSGEHEGSFNNVQAGFWAGLSKDGHYPYWGKSKTSTGNPLNVKDNAVHPPSDSNRMIVLRIQVDRAAIYSMDLFGAVRHDGPHLGSRCGSKTRLAVYAGPVEKYSTAEASTLPSPTTINHIIQLGHLGAGSFVYITLRNVNGYDCDANFLRWRLAADHLQGITVTNGQGSVILIVCLVTGDVFLLCVCALAAWFCYCRRKEASVVDDLFDESAQSDDGAATGEARGMPASKD